MGHANDTNFNIIATLMFYLKNFNSQWPNQVVLLYLIENNQAPGLARSEVK